MLVGIGPGSTEHMTARARAAIAEADTIIGYVTYIKLVADLIEGKEIIRKSMTEELDRAIEALERARQGKKVALVSSGDAGVYGMAGPTFEVLLQAGWVPPVQREAGRYDAALGRRIAWGASPRGSIALERCARARAWLAGRDYVVPEDVRAVAPDVLRHRVLPSYEALAEGWDGDRLVAALLEKVPVP